MENKLPELSRAKPRQSNPGEALTLAFMCQQPSMKRFAASARLYALGFTGDPRFAADLGKQHRYNAACSASLAAAGQGRMPKGCPIKSWSCSAVGRCTGGATT